MDETVSTGEDESISFNRAYDLAAAEPYVLFFCRENIKKQE